MFSKKGGTMQTPRYTLAPPSQLTNSVFDIVIIIL